jgi:2-dehydro-3-deoxyglucarate aldolase/4-hydroxy-2-oxoheptanedioate aldolase
MKQSLRKDLIEGKSLTGTLLTLPSPEVAEILAKSGFDWLFIDLEHSAISLQTAQTIIQAASSQSYCVIRCPSNDEAWINRCLDTGADGIIIPQVKTQKEAEYAAHFAKYAPLGGRSVGISRAHGYGMTFNEYMERANEDTALIIQCEHIEAIDNLPAILEVEGIDCVFVGPYDLSASMNKTGQLKDPEVVNAIERIRKMASESNMPLGIFGTAPEFVKAYKEKGFNLLTVNADTLMLSRSAMDVLQNIND